VPSTTTQQFAGEHFTLNSISEGRRGQVLTALTQLQAFINSDPALAPRALEQATDADLRAWQVSLLERGLAPSTVGWHLKMVKPFYQWCWQARLIDAEALMRVSKVSPPRGHNSAAPRPYAYKDLVRFWAELDAKWPYTEERFVKRFRRGTSPYRGRIKKHAMRLQLDAIIELALVCGLRRSEIYTLSLDDCHWDNAYVVVYGKRHDQNPKVRDVPYPDSARDAVKAWLHFRGILGATCPQLWLSISGPEPLQPLTADRMKMLLHNFGDWQLHRLRHTCATERLRAGMELEKLQRFLGHANITQTLKYAELVRGDIHKSSEKIDASFQRAIHPRPAPPE
jgi:site-specific recombinase XerD